MADPLLLSAIHEALEDETDHIVTKTACADVAAHVAGHPALAPFRNEDGVPDEFRGMSSRDRGIYLSVERVYDATLRAEGIEKNERSRTPFRDLVPDAQQAVVSTLLPVIQMLHALALNPKANRHTPPPDES